MVIDGDLRIGTSAVLTFIECDVTVKGDVEVNGGWLDVRGNSKFTAEKNVKLLSAGVMRVWAGPTNGVDALEWSDCGASVKVVQNMRLEDSSVLFVRSEGRNGGSPKFEIKSLYVATDAAVNGVGRGWGYYDFATHGNNANCPSVGPGGAKSSSYSGASYGGFGGGRYCYTNANGTVNSTYYKGTYGSMEEPTDPGSDGILRTGWNGGWGGGLFKVVIARDLVVDGSINMNGLATQTKEEGGGSGGGVNIRCRTLSGSGRITANGGNGGSNVQFSGGGGGGRIAIRCARNLFTGVVEANGARNYVYNYPAQDGTIYWKLLPVGFRVIVR